MASDPTNPSGGSYSLDKSKIKFLLLEGIHERAREILAGHGYEQAETLRRALSGGELREALRGVQFLGMNVLYHDIKHKLPLGNAESRASL